MHNAKEIYDDGIKKGYSGKKLIYWFCIIAVMCLMLTSCSGGMSKGDIVTFGVYDKNDFGSEMTLPDHGWSTPIEWIVVDNSGDLFTLLSKDIMWTYDNEVPRHANTYKASLAYEDANGVFYDNAFSDEEKEAMGYFTDSEENQYNVSMPTYDEITTWFSSDEDRIAHLYKGGEHAYDLLGGGTVNFEGKAEDDEPSLVYANAVRPLICVDKKYLSKRGEQQVEKVDRYKDVEAGGISFTIPIDFEEDVENSSDKMKIFTCIPRGTVHYLLAISSVDGNIKDEEIDKNLDLLFDSTYVALDLNKNLTNERGKFENDSGITAYKSDDRVVGPRAPRHSQAYILNNSADGTVVRVLYIASPTGDNSPSGRGSRTGDNIVKTAKLINGQ